MAKGTLNKVLLIGRLGQDPEIRHTQDGRAVATFSIATNESWRDKEGNQQERTDWHNCVAFGATAEKYIEPYVKKGTLVSIEGTLQTRDWEDKETGAKRYKTEVFVNPFGGIQILGSAGDGGNYDSSAGMDQTPKTSEENTSQVTEDDLPF